MIKMSHLIIYTLYIDPVLDTIVGVHCTHGINRTGYLVCRYMVQRLSWSAEEAISAFGAARGHPLERENYLEDLKNSRWSDIPKTTHEGEDKDEQDATFISRYGH